MNALACIHMTLIFFLFQTNVILRKLAETIQEVILHNSSYSLKSVFCITTVQVSRKEFQRWYMFIIIVQIIFSGFAIVFHFFFHPRSTGVSIFEGALLYMIFSCWSSLTCDHSSVLFFHELDMKIFILQTVFQFWFVQCLFRVIISYDFCKNTIEMICSSLDHIMELMMCLYLTGDLTGVCMLMICIHLTGGLIE